MFKSYSKPIEEDESIGAYEYYLPVEIKVIIIKTAELFMAFFDKNCYFKNTFV